MKGIIKKIGNLYRLTEVFFSYKTGKSECNYLPLRVWIEPTSYCNLRCRVCPNERLPQSQKGFMSMDLFKKIIDQLSGNTYDLNLFHRGESLIHPELIDMIRYARLRGIYTRLHTNATLLSDKVSRDLIGSGLDFISFSFDGYDKGVYENNRLNSNFEKTREGIIQFLNFKVKTNSTHPYTVLQVMEYGDNREGKLIDIKRKEFLAPLERLRLDKFIIRKPHNWGGLIDELADNTHSKNRRLICTFPWYAMVILWNGEVTPCPQDFEGRIILGDMNEEDLINVWNGSRMRAFRKDMVKKKVDAYPPCRDCDRLFRDTLLGVPTEYLKNFLSDNILGYRTKFRR